MVTGGGRRVGRAVALELARCGFDVAIHYRGSENEAREVELACTQLGAESWTARADLATTEGCLELVDAIRARWDRLDLLVNNASLYEGVPFERITPAEWDRMQAVNVRAPFLLSQGLLPLLRHARGLVVHLCDIGGERPVRGFAHYSVSKAALAMLVKAMAVELAPAVRAVGISPGHVVWPEHFDEVTRTRLARRIPMGEVGDPGDVARLVRFLATEAPYLNGAIVAVDGGLSCRY